MRYYTIPCFEVSAGIGIFLAGSKKCDIGSYKCCEVMQFNLNTVI